MMAESDLLLGVAFLAVLALIICVNLFLHRHARKDAVRDSESILGELRLAVENATQSCRLMDVRADPWAFSGRVNGYGIGPVSYYRIVRLELFNHKAPAAPKQAPESSSGMEWRCNREAVAAGIAHIDLDYEQQLERMFLVMQSDEGVYEEAYCKAGDFMSTGGGILKLSFNGRHQGIVNFSADGTVTDAKNKKAGIASWDGVSMAVALHGKKYALTGPAYLGSAFRILEQNPKFAGIPEDDRMLLLCLSVFNQAYRRARRVARGSS